jgi:hypothetical protein
MSAAEQGAATGEFVMSWQAAIDAARKQRQAAALALEGDSWLLPLGRLHGHTGDDGVERVTTQVVLDLLEVPQCSRRAGTYRRLARLMAELGWTAVRVRGLTRGGYLEQVRGFARPGRSGHGSAASTSRAHH